MWRYAVVYTYGGVYADVDTDCLRPISSWLRPDCELLVGLENDEHFCQWTFAAAPRSRYLKAVLAAIVETFEQHGGIDTGNQHFVHKHSGPGVFTQGLSRAFAEYLGLPGHTINWNAREWFDHFNQTEGFAQGICIEDETFFGSINARNNYASQQKLKGWTSWTQAAAEITSRN